MLVRHKNRIFVKRDDSRCNYEDKRSIYAELFSEQHNPLFRIIINNANCCMNIVRELLIVTTMILQSHGNVF